jgi:energy-coupling factor transporter transmembrane protein EcfT
MNAIAMLDQILSHQVLGISVFMYLGIFALLSLLLAAYLAYARKPKGSFMKWHHSMVGVSLFLALLHAVSAILVTRPAEGTHNHHKFDNKLIKLPEMVAGKKIFNQICSGCHENGGNILTPDLPIKGSHKLTNYESFLSFIRDPKMPDGSTGSMPSFPESRLSNEDTKQLYNYLVYEYGLIHRP